MRSQGRKAKREIVPPGTRHPTGSDFLPIFRLGHRGYAEAFVREGKRKRVAARTYGLVTALEATVHRRSHYLEGEHTGAITAIIAVERGWWLRSALLLVLALLLLLLLVLLLVTGTVVGIVILFAVALVLLVLVPSGLAAEFTKVWYGFPHRKRPFVAGAVAVDLKGLSLFPRVAETELSGGAVTIARTPKLQRQYELVGFRPASRRLFGHLLLVCQEKPSRHRRS